MRFTGPLERGDMFGKWQPQPQKPPPEPSCLSLGSSSGGRGRSSLRLDVDPSARAGTGGQGWGRSGLREAGVKIRTVGVGEQVLCVGQEKQL